MFKKLLALLPIVACLLAPGPARAHSLWVNLFESHAHLPGHVISSIGWGHAIPMDDLVGNLKLESYDLVDPAFQATPLPMPVKNEIKPVETASGIMVHSGDIGVRKMALSDKTVPGAYQVVLTTKDNFYSRYLDAKGKNKWAPKTMDQIKDAKKVLSGMKYKAYAKSYFTVKKWSEPKPMGHDLEIIPLSDLSNVRVGDKVDFQITFMGKPLTTSPEVSIETITAVSNTFGGPDKFMLSSMIFKGKGGFRMPTAGQWLVNVYTKQPVTPDNDLKHLVGKCTVAMYAATITFSVKP